MSSLLPLTSPPIKPSAVPQPPPDPPTDRQQKQGQRPRSRSRSCLSILTFLVISLCFVHYWISSSSLPIVDDWHARAQAISLLKSLESQLEDYTAWLNGAELIDFAFPSVPDEQTKIVAAVQPPGIVLNSTKQSYFSNVTGYIRGEATAYNLYTPPANAAWAHDALALMAGLTLDLNEVVDKLGKWDWKAVDRVTLDILERRPNDSKANSTKEAEDMKKIVEDTPDIVSIEGYIELVDHMTEDGLRLELSGIHFVSNGSFVAVANPVASSLDARTLPAFVPPSVRNATAYALLPALHAQINTLRARVISPAPFSPLSSASSSLAVPASTCAFAVYAQLAPSNINAERMSELEAETAHPTDAQVTDRPNLLVDLTLVSPECGILIVVGKAGKPKLWEVILQNMARYSGFSALVNLILLILLMREMRRTDPVTSPMGITRWAFFIQILADEISALGHFTVPTYVKSRPSLYVSGFLSLFLFLFQTVFVANIMSAQEPEDAASKQAAASGGGAGGWLAKRTEKGGAQATPAVTPATLPPLPAAPAKRPSFLRRTWDELRTDRDSQIFLFLVIPALVFVMCNVLVPHLAALGISAFYLSIWTTQIIRTVIVGRTCGLSGEYMVGTTICRLAIVMYFVACIESVQAVKSKGWIYALALAMFAQVGIITLQKVLGSAFFLPERFTPSAASYDYHPLLKPKPSGEEAAETRSLGNCAICKDMIRYDADVYVDKIKETRPICGAPLSISRVYITPLTPEQCKLYSLSPCNHIFHTDCLETWFINNTGCPQCKGPLPPL